MSSFNEFIERELPRRPFTLEDGQEGQVLVRSDKPERSRELVWANFDEVHNHDDRYPVLDSENLIPKEYIPKEFKQSKVVDDINERDNLSDVYEGLRVHVLDATADETVGSGGAGYIYHNEQWYKIYEEESLDIELSWTEIKNKPELYTKSETDSLLDEKLDKESNLSDVDDRQAALDNLTNASSELTDKVLSIDNDGKAIWRTIDKYTKSEVDSKLDDKADTSYVQDTYLAKDSNLNDVTDRQDALNNLTDSESASEDEVLSVDAEGNSVWRTIDKYTKSEVDSKLDDKADTSYVQDTYLAKDSNLNDVTNRQTSLDNLTNVSTASKDHVLSVDDEGKTAWREIDKYTKSEVDSKLDGKSDVEHNHDDRYPVLDENDLIPSENIPPEFRESRVVSNITERDAISEKHDGLRVHVLDATDDPTVDDGGAGYIYYEANQEWIKIYEDAALDLVVNWDDVENKPDLYTKSEVDSKLDDKADTSYVQDTYLAKNQNLEDLENRIAAINYLLNTDSGDQDDVLSIDSNGEVTWRIIDKYTKSEIDSKLDDKADNTEVQDTYLAKDSNLNDVQSRQEALDNLTNADVSKTDKILSVDSSGHSVWRTIDKYTQSEVDSKLDDKADTSYVQGTYLAKDSNLNDVTSRQEALNNLTDANTDKQNKVLSVDSNGTVVWRALDKYTQSEIDAKLDEKSDDDHTHEWNEIEDKPELYNKSEIDSKLDDKADTSYVQDTYLAKNQNLHDLESRTDALNYLVNANTDKQNKVLSVDSNGKVVWRTIDKYTKSEIDTLLDGKADDDHVHNWDQIEDKPELYNKSEIDSKLDDKADDDHTHTEEEITDLDKYTKSEVDSLIEDSKDDRIITKEYIIKIGPGSTVEERADHPDTVLPDGWIAFPASDSRAHDNMGTDSNTMVIEHTTDYHFIADLQFIEQREGGPPAAQGYTKINRETVSIPWRHTLDYNNYKQIQLRDIMSTVSDSSAFLVFMKLAYMPTND